MRESLHHLCFPGESKEYRAKRNVLLAREMALRREVEAVAAQRRSLPDGGVPPEDYRFVGQHGPVTLSEMFGSGKDTLAIYSFMFGPERDTPCPGCTHFLDGLDGMVKHIEQRINFAVVAKSPFARLQALASERGWRYLPLYATAGNHYDRDYYGDSSALSPALRAQQEFKDGEEWDMPMLNVFRRDGSTIRHCWGSELLYVPPEPGQEYRHNDLLNPLWNILDLTPAGRGAFQPRLEYR
jgi:predicted dithiol-disulfide oxidoreductase (DUF899 family)